jgi:hypothetical protein
MRLQYTENECWGLGKEEGLMSKVEGVKVFFVRRKRKGDWRGVGFCGGRSFG